MTEEVDAAARTHLLRDDRQEDVCFGLWLSSRGATRESALVQKLILPRDGERRVHGNASFQPEYFERALSEAAASGAGLALLHSHPFGTDWQGMSPDDVAAEKGHAAAVFGATDLPFVGLTLPGDGRWSARFWKRTAPRKYSRLWCDRVRVVGDRLALSFNPEIAARPNSTKQQIRTVAAWGEEAQADFARLRIGLVGAGSVGGFIGEALARSGCQHIVIIDFDLVEEHNLDRLVYAMRRDIGEPKSVVLAKRLKKIATANRFAVDSVVRAVYEEAAYRRALDCDLLVCCVDRPWGRHVLNYIAYAHLVPVVDGGILVRTNRLGHLAAADWRATTATVGRPCLQCVGQYDPGLVQVERDGLLEDPKYIEGLPRDHPLRQRENVFGFSMSCAGMQFMQMLALVMNPLDQPNPGLQRYHFVGNFMEPPEYGACHEQCLFPSFIARGDTPGFVVTKTVSTATKPTTQTTRLPRWVSKIFTTT
jgi:hypothetical protein